MEHLATEATVAFVDGELSMTAYQRAAAHLSVCRECAADVEAQRYARRAVRSAAPLFIPADLRGMLCRIPETNAPASEVGPREMQQAPLPPLGSAARTKRSLSLGVFAASALAVGVLAATATGPETTAPNPTVQTVAVPAQRGAQVLAADPASHTPVVSFAVVFADAGQVGVAARPGARQLESVYARPGQAGISP